MSFHLLLCIIGIKKNRLLLGDMMKKVRKACLIITTIACLNYAMVAIFKLDLLKKTFTNIPQIRAVLYCLIAISGLINLLYLGDEDEI